MVQAQSNQARNNRFTPAEDARQKAKKKRRIRRRKRMLLLLECCMITMLSGKLISLAEQRHTYSRQDMTTASQSAPSPASALQSSTDHPQKETTPAGALQDSTDHPQNVTAAPGAAQNDSTVPFASEGQTDLPGETTPVGSPADGILILVNRDHPLPEDFQPDLVTTKNGRNQCAREAYDPLCDMLKAGSKEGLTFVICSGYRTEEYQKKLFDEDVKALTDRGWSYEKAYEEVAKETMPPGCSEHSTGLALDIVAFDYQSLDAGQEKTAENKWLREHCAEYGFILRYPKGSEDITGINYESWHFRYVGKEAAAYITEQGITLEEYLQQ